MLSRYLLDLLWYSYKNENISTVCNLLVSMLREAEVDEPSVVKMLCSTHAY
jgi:hypothetical protein